MAVGRRPESRGVQRPVGTTMPGEVEAMALKDTLHRDRFFGEPPSTCHGVRREAESVEREVAEEGSGRHVEGQGR